VPATLAAPPELANRPRRRSFTAQDKLRILAETDRAAATGGIAAILRREGLYSSNTTDWRPARDAGAISGLNPVKRGPKIAEPNPLAADNARLQQDNARLSLRLTRAEGEPPPALCSMPMGSASLYSVTCAPGEAGAVQPVEDRCR
jgi:transposase